MKRSDSHDLIGKAETASLEFKAAEALEKPAIIAREVVAFLNGGGGKIWIGVIEQAGIATSLESISNITARRDALWNHLVDTIEPSPMNSEVKIESVEIDPSNGQFLAISVNHGRRGPYALVKDRGRHFIVRVGPRVRDMSRAEIEAAFRDARGVTATKSDVSHAEIEAKVLKEVEVHRGKDVFWWTIAPVPPVSIDYERMNVEDKIFCRTLLTDPSFSGNRRSGWTMVLDGPVRDPKTTGIKHVYGEGPLEHRVLIDREGKASFVAPRARLDRDWNRSGVDIFPFALLELPVSGFRMMAKFLQHFAGGATPQTVIVAAVIGGMRGAALSPGSPAMPRLPWREARTFEEADLVVTPFGVDVAGEDFLQKPDAAAYRLILRIYEQFGFAAEDIPEEFCASDRVLRFRSH